MLPPPSPKISATPSPESSFPSSSFQIQVALTPQTPLSSGPTTANTSNTSLPPSTTSEDKVQLLFTIPLSPPLFSQSNAHDESTNEAPATNEDPLTQISHLPSPPSLPNLTLLQYATCFPRVQLLLLLLSLLLWQISSLHRTQKFH